MVVEAVCGVVDQDRQSLRSVMLLERRNFFASSRSSKSDLVSSQPLGGLDWRRYTLFMLKNSIPKPRRHFRFRFSIEIL